MQLDEIMLTFDTTMVEPWLLPACMSRDEPLCDDAVEPPVVCEPVEPVAPLCAPVDPLAGALCEPVAPVEPLGDAELLIGDEPPIRPVTVTW